MNLKERGGAFEFRFAQGKLPQFLKRYDYQSYIPIAFRSKTGQWTFGRTPKLDVVTPPVGTISPYQPQTLFEEGILLKNAGKFVSEPSIGATGIVEGKSVSKAEQVELIQKQILAGREAQTMKYRYLDRELFTQGGTKYLTPENAQRLKAEASKRGFTEFGSGASMPQNYPIVRRQIGDDDFFFKTRIEQRLGYKTIGLEKTIVGQKARWNPEDPFLLEVFVKSGEGIPKGGAFVKAAEFKGIGVGSGQSVPPLAYGRDLSIGKGLRYEYGRRIASLESEMARKQAASLMFSQSGALGVAHSGRTKDVPDFARFMYTAYVQRTSARRPTGFIENYLKTAGKIGIDYRGTPSASAPIPQQSGSPIFLFPQISGVSRSPIPSRQSFMPDKNLFRVSFDISTSPSARPSYKLFPQSPSPSYKISPSVSPSARSPSSRSPRSPSPYSPSPSPYASASPYLTSPSPSFSPSPSRSPSVSPSPYLSPSVSQSPSPSPYLTPYRPPPPPPNYDFGGALFGKKTKGIELSKKRKFRYTPTIKPLLLGITGKAPKIITGIESRPLVRGSKFSKGFKLPKLF